MSEEPLVTVFKGSYNHLIERSNRLIEAESRIQQLENDQLMLQGQLDMSRALVAGAKAEIAQLEEALRIALINWRENANAEAQEGCSLEEANDEEAVLYRQLWTILSPSEAPEKEE